MEVPKSLFLPFLPLQLMLAVLSWSHGRSPTMCSSLSYGVSSGGAGLWLALGAWEQLEPLGKFFSLRNWAALGQCEPRSPFPGEQPARSSAGRAAVPAPPMHSHLPSPSSAAFHGDHKHFQKRKAPSKWSRGAGGLGQMLPTGAHLGPWVQ